MKRSTERILTTHTGSLPRPAELVELLVARERGDALDKTALAGRISDAVTDVVGKQVETGIDVVNDGEAGKPSFATYVKDRLNGFGGDAKPEFGRNQDAIDFPGFVMAGGETRAQMKF